MSTSGSNVLYQQTWIIHIVIVLEYISKLNLEFLHDIFSDIWYDTQIRICWWHRIMLKDCVNFFYFKEIIWNFLEIWHNIYYLLYRSFLNLITSTINANKGHRKLFSLDMKRHTKVHIWSGVGRTFTGSLHRAGTNKNLVYSCKFSK